MSFQSPTLQACHLAVVRRPNAAVLILLVIVGGANGIGLATVDRVGRIARHRWNRVGTGRLNRQLAQRKQSNDGLRAQLIVTLAVADAAEPTAGSEGLNKQEVKLRAALAAAVMAIPDGVAANEAQAKKEVALEVLSAMADMPEFRKLLAAQAPVPSMSAILRCFES